MGLFFLTVKNIVRSHQSAVASASYRSGESLYSERDGEVKSFKKREVKPDSFILAPKHAPEWATDREKLWNEVEKIENRWNSRLAREVLVALPIELNHEQQKQMLIEFVKENFVNEGMVADVSIHRDVKHNPHAHIMLTVRPFNEDGTWGQKQKREYLFDENGNPILDKNGKHKFVAVNLTNWNDKQTLLNWRKNYAEKINEWYRKLGINEKVSHESYEKQGLNKLPKQRLTVNEYHLEKRMKEKAVANGTSYEPVTYYGKLNQKIEQVNKEIEKIDKEIYKRKEKVVSLSDYRQKFENEKINKLNSIRKNANLSKDDWNAIKTVAGRLDGFVDFNRANDNLKKLDKWRVKLEQQKREIRAEELVLKKANILFKEQPSKVLLYGFKPTYFKEEMSEKINLLKQKFHKFNESQNVFNELYEKSKRVLEIQKQFANEEFAFLYPDYAEKFNENTEQILSIKSKYVELFRNEGIVRQTIPEFEHESYKLTKDYQELSNVIKEWKDVKYSLVIAERTKEKYKREYRESYEKFNAKEVYNNSIRYTQAKEQINEKEAIKESLKEKLFEQMILRYPEYSQNIIRDIPSEIQARVLELHLNQEHTGKLSDDLKLVKEHFKEKDKDFENQENHQELAGLLESLVINLKQNEHKDDDLERKRKQKQKKRYRDIGELEI